MLIYSLMFLITLFFAFFQKRVKKGIYRKFIFLLSLIPPIFVAMFRYNNGADYMMYYRIFKSAGSASVTSSVQGKTIEIGFLALIKLCNSIYQEPWFTFGIIAIIIIYLFYKGCLTNSDNYTLSIILFFSTGIYFDSFNGLRQYIAVAIFFYAIKYILKKDLKKFIIFIVIGCLFHYSIIFCLPIYFLRNVKIDLKKACLVILLSTIFGTAIYRIILFILPYTTYSYFLRSVEFENVVPSESSILLFSVTTILGYWFYSKSKNIDENTQFIFNCHVVMNAIAILTAFVPLMSRFLYYGMALDLLYIPKMLLLVRKKKQRQIITLFVILLYLSINVYGMIENGWYTCLPYNFYFK